MCFYFWNPFLVYLTKSCWLYKIAGASTHITGGITSLVRRGISPAINLMVCSSGVNDKVKWAHLEGSR